MKNITRLCFLFLAFIFSSYSFSQTFDFETAVIDGGNDKIVTQMVSGITMTLTGTSSAILANLGGFGGSSGITYHPSNNGGTITLSFSSPINITSLRAYNAGDNGTGDWTFTPTGGSNSIVGPTTVPGTAGVTVALNWTEVTSFTMTNSSFQWMTFDTVDFTETLGVDGFVFDTFRFYPNPTTDTITLSALEKIDKVFIYNLLGQRVLDQTIGVISSILNIANLSRGTYIMEVSIDGQLDNFKIIKN